ncbi:MAG: hypothetical protein SCH70_06300 [Candidatus Methanoperedens sp.]|nr:hypothetical protein [Candidatus Methanoperedens sp.]
MKKSRRQLSAMLMAMLLLSMVFVVVVNAQYPNKVLSPFQPSINDKLSYEEELRLIKNYTPTPPMPDSDIARIVVPEAWLLPNDEDARIDIVKITFPVDWLNKTQVSDNEPIVLLRIPKKMLGLDDTNEDPNRITISYPVDMFEFYTNITAMSKGRVSSEKVATSTNGKSSLSQLSGNLTGAEPISIQGIDYQERANYQRNSGYTVIRVTGLINPYSYSNQGETFRNYNEREIYLDRTGDAAEVISDFTDIGNAYVWVSIFDEGSWITSWDWLNVNVTGTLQPIEYYFYINSGVYDVWLKDTSSGTWYYKSYDDTDNPGTYIDWLKGSTEIDSAGGISKYFRTETNPIRDDWTYASGTWYRPKTTFNWYGYTSNQQYVYINAWWDSSDRINTQHVTGSSIT